MILFYPILSLLIQFDLICSNLIFFNPVLSNSIQFGATNLIIWINLIQIDLVWSNLNQFYMTWTIELINSSWSFLSNLNQFEAIWSHLIQFQSIWSNLIQLDPIWTSIIWFEPNNQPDPSWFFSIQYEMKCSSNIGEKSNLVKFNPFRTDLIQSDPK